MLFIVGDSFLKKFRFEQALYRTFYATYHLLQPLKNNAHSA